MRGSAQPSEATEGITSHSDLIDTSTVHSDESIDSDTTNLLRRRGCVLIRNVVPDEEALSWKQQLRQYVTENPDVVGTSFESPLTRKETNHSLPGYPAENKQFFHV